jgi:hypothetical protein
MEDPRAARPHHSSLQPRSLPVREREIAKIVAIIFDQIERVDHRSVGSLRSAQLVE